MREGKIAMVINTPDAVGTADSFSIRRTALELRLPFFTTMAGAQAAVEAIAALKDGALEVRALQDYHRIVTPIIAPLSCGAGKPPRIQPPRHGASHSLGPRRDAA